MCFKETYYSYKGLKLEKETKLYHGVSSFLVVLLWLYHNQSQLPTDISIIPLLSWFWNWGPMRFTWLKACKKFLMLLCKIYYNLISPLILLYTYTVIGTPICSREQHQKPSSITNHLLALPSSELMLNKGFLMNYLEGNVTIYIGFNFCSYDC